MCHNLLELIHQSTKFLAPFFILALTHVIAEWTQLQMSYVRLNLFEKLYKARPACPDILHYYIILYCYSYISYYYICHRHGWFFLHRTANKRCSPVAYLVEHVPQIKTLLQPPGLESSLDPLLYAIPSLSLSSKAEMQKKTNLFLLHSLTDKKNESQSLSLRLVSPCWKVPNLSALVSYIPFCCMTAYG